MRFSKVAAVAAIALAAAGWQVAAQSPTPAQIPANVDSKRIVAADKSPGDWLTVGRTYDEQRFSPLKQINEANVDKLGLAWSAELGTLRGVEATPLVIDGVLYNTSAWNITTAYDGKTGKVLWSYDPKVPAEWGRYACCDIVSRGLAAWKGKIIIATLDGRVIALDAKTGKPIWTTETLDKTWPYSVTGGPRVFDGKVLIGNGGAELGVRGYVTALDAETGKQAWRFYTVPGDPSKGFEDKAMEMAAKTWNGEWWKLGGGGTAWDSIVYDPELKLIYIGVGNGSPWVQKYRSPGGGDNLFLSSIVAVKADTGEYVWHYQQAPGEQWDYTATQPMMLAELKIGGKPRKVLMQAPKNGFFYVIDRTNGKLISANNYVPVTWAKGIDMKTGRPIENPEIRYGEKPVLMSPGPSGAHNWNPMAFNPQTGLVYFPVMETYYTLSADAKFTPVPFRSNLGIGMSGYEDERKKLLAYGEANKKAWLTAWNPVTQKEAWRVPFPRDGSGGVLATAGGLVFLGTTNMDFAAYRATDGKRLWTYPVQTIPVAAPATYTIDGEQYVALNAGWGGGTAHMEQGFGKQLHVASARLLVFKLGGTATLPPLSDVPPPAPPPRLTVSEAVVKQGGEIYGRTCAACHGSQARGGIKDLRLMTPETHKAFNDIVLKGTRASQGMASFADLISQADVDAVHGYLIARANEDWGQMEK